MKTKYFLLFNICLFLFTNYSFSQSGWVKQYLGNSTFETIHFFNQNTGYAANYDGTLYKSTNGGINWTSSSDVYKIYSGYYFDENNFVLVGTQAYYRAWAGVYINGIRTDYFFYPSQSYMHFTTTDWINENTGFAAGTDWDMGGTLGKAFKTTNRGLNWTDVTPALSIFVNDISFINANTGYLLVPDVRKTTNAGNNWVLCDESYNTGGNSLAIANPDTIFIIGYYGHIFFSSNGGTNWSSRSISSSASLDGVNFINGKTGWICGGAGLVMRTTNAGENWNGQMSGTLARLKTIQILDSNNLWIAGDSGVILHTTTGGLTFINEYTHEIPSSFNLEQNFPNPFNPVTRIRYELPRAGVVRLVVYDVMGREVETLVNERQTAGSYEAVWDGTRFASGVYFYRLTADGFSETRKMLMIR